MIASSSQGPNIDGPSELTTEATDAAAWPSRDAERKRLLQLRDDLRDAVRAEMDQKIIDRLRPLVRDMLRGSSAPWRIGGYWPIRHEPDIRPLFHELTKGGHRIGLPLVDRVQRPLTFVLWKPQSAMAPGFLGVPVPTSGKAVYVELLLVPCLGFSVSPDGVLHRLGYGGGYYDRTLAARRCKTIGIAYEEMHATHFEPGPHDVPLDHIVTEACVR
jgi:5,10-methenyltetrahydrofolate synthetase